MMQRKLFAIYFVLLVFLSCISTVDSHTQSGQHLYKNTEIDFDTTIPIIIPTTINVTLNDPEGDTMDIYIYTNDSGFWRLVNSSLGLANGSYSFINTSWIDTWDVSYNLTFNSTDGNDWTNTSYTFLTRSIPEFNNESIEPATGVEEDTVFYFNVSIRDDDNDTQSVRVNITRGAWFSNTSMTYVTGFNNSGANYTYNRDFPSSGTYDVEFISYDGYFWNTSSGFSFIVTANSSFQVNFPVFREVGDYILAEGSIRDASGNPINSTWCYTKILNSTDWSTVPHSSLEKYIVNGYYSYTFSTTSMTPGIYYINVNYTHGGTNFFTNWTLYLSDYSGPGHYATDIYFSFYDSNSELEIEPLSFKIYCDDEYPLTANDRLYTNTFRGYLGQTIYYRIDDYFDNQIYPSSGTNESEVINQLGEVIEIPITWYPFKFGNLNNDYYNISLLKDGGSRWYEKGIIPYGEAEFLLPSGNYHLFINDSDGTNVYTDSSVSVTSPCLYIINGSHLSLVINGQTTMIGYLLDIIGDVTPSIIKVGYNIPFIRLGEINPISSLIESNVTLVCPPQILEGTTYNHTFTNRSIHPCIPGNASENGTITVPDVDRLWFQGSTGDWVNVSYDNGTLIQNTSYVPTFLDLNGAPTIWVNSSHNISLTRETRYHQVIEFDYTHYTDLNKYQATVNFTNPLNKAIEEVSLYIAFADDGNTPDYGGVEVYDVTNSIYLTEGEHYDSSAIGIEMAVSSMNAGESREFQVTYYVSEENIQPKEAIVVLNDFGQLKSHEGKNYYYLGAQWINRNSDSFVGPIYIQFNFTIPNIISRESIDVWDDHNRRYLRRDQFAWTESGVIITQEVVGRVSPQGARSYDIYYLYTAETTIENIVFSFLDAPVIANVPGVGDILGIHIISIILLLIGITAIFSGKTYKDHLWVFASCMLFIFLCTMAWLSPA